MEHGEQDSGNREHLARPEHEQLQLQTRAKGIRQRAKGGQREKGKVRL
jgi:hypothetical protein